MSPVPGRHPRAPRSRPVNPGEKALGLGKGHHGVGKADRHTESDRTGRGAAHHAGPRATPERHVAGHNQGRWTGAKQQRQRGAANPGSAYSTQRTTAREQVPGNRAAVQMDVCAPSSEPSPCRPQNSRHPDGRVRARQRTQPQRATNQPPFGCTCAPPGGTQTLPAAHSRHPDERVRARQQRPKHPCGPRHRTGDTTHRACTAVNRSQVAQDTAHAAQRTGPEHR